jgi:TldD protein
MALSRRKFLKCSSATAVSGLLLPQQWAIGQPAQHTGRYHNIRVGLEDAKALAVKAVDAARSAGAQFADARLTRTVTQTVILDTGKGGLTVLDDEVFSAGVRVLVNGSWGFASSPYWIPSEMTALVTSAVTQAATYARRMSRKVEWMSIPPVTGDWVPPEILDPLTVAMEEKNDFLRAIQALLPDLFGTEFSRWKDEGVTLDDGGRFEFTRQERIIASTEGSLFSQTQFRTNGAYLVDGRSTIRIPLSGMLGTMHGAGWEIYQQAKILDQYQPLGDQIKELLSLPVKPLDIGKYDIVCDGRTMASFIGRLLGPATDLARSMGYEANARGSTFLGPDPLKFLGTYQVGSPAVTVTADRSLPGGLATVKWDDEGVIPEEVPLIKNGILNDYQTTREQAPWLAPWYQKSGRPIRSHGYAGAESAKFPIIQYRPNLTLEPASDNVTMNDLIAQIKKGIAIYQWSTSGDFQVKNGFMEPPFGSWACEIVNGKLSARLIGGSALFTTPEFLKNIVAVGGANSQDMVGMRDHAGQPSQRMFYSVRAVPALVRNVTIIDPNRKA